MFNVFCPRSAKILGRFLLGGKKMYDLTKKILPFRQNGGNFCYIVVLLCRKHSAGEAETSQNQ